MMHRSWVNCGNGQNIRALPYNTEINSNIDHLGRVCVYKTNECIKKVITETLFYSNKIRLIFAGHFYYDTFSQQKDTLQRI